MYEKLGHAEVVQLELDGNAAENEMRAFADKYFAQFVKTPFGMMRQVQLVASYPRLALPEADAVLSGFILFFGCFLTAGRCLLASMMNVITCQKSHGASPSAYWFCIAGSSGCGQWLQECRWYPRRCELTTVQGSEGNSLALHQTSMALQSSKKYSISCLEVVMNKSAINFLQHCESTGAKRKQNGLAGG